MGTLGGATVWRGTAFDCSLYEITLLHSRFADGIFGVCNIMELGKEPFC